MNTPLENQIRKLFMEMVVDAQDGFNSVNGEMWKIDVNNIKWNLKQIEEKLKQLKQLKEYERTIT